MKTKALCLALLSALSLAAPGDAFAGAGDIDVDDTLNDGALGSSRLAGTEICITPGSACYRNAVVGFRSSSGDLKLTRYDATSIVTTGIERPVSNTAGPISSTSPIAMTSLPPPTAIDPTYYVVSAFKDGGGDLMLIVWGAQSLARLGDNVLSGFPGPAISEVAVTQVSFDTGNPDSSDRVVTAVRTAGGSLQLTSWDIVDLPATSDVEVVELDTITFGDASQIDLDSIGTTIDQSVVVAFRNNSGNLQLKTLAIDAAGDFTERHNYTSGAASRVKVRKWGAGAVTAIRDGSDDLLVTRWDIDGAGNISWQGNSGNQAGYAQEISLSKFGDLYTAVRTSSGDMMVLEWSITTGSPTRINDSGSDGDSLLSGADIFVTGGFGGAGGHSLTAGRRADGGLQGRLWTH